MTSSEPLLVALPAPRLRPYVSHYWLSRHNREDRQTVLPDGSVDLVVAGDGASAQAWVYGTTTAPQSVTLASGAHYLGVRFHPGQSRHFLRAAAAELTDTHEPAHGLLAFDLQDLPGQLVAGPVFAGLDAVLERYLRACPPTASNLDAAIRSLAVTGTPVAQAARLYGKSLRQFERQFQLDVGVGPKLYARIARFQRAARLLAGSPLTLAELAADLGYSDQSHMSHEFRRFAGLSPSAYARQPVDFLQDR